MFTFNHKYTNDTLIKIQNQLVNETCSWTIEIVNVHGKHQLFLCPNLLPDNNLVVDVYPNKIVDIFLNLYGKSNLPLELIELIELFLIWDQNAERRQIIFGANMLLKQLHFVDTLNVIGYFSVFSPSFVSIKIDLNKEPFILGKKEQDFQHSNLSPILCVRDSIKVNQMYRCLLIITMNEEQLKYCFDNQLYELLIVYARLLNYISEQEFKHQLIQFRMFEITSTWKDKPIGDFYRNLMKCFKSTWKHFIKL